MQNFPLVNANTKSLIYKNSQDAKESNYNLHKL